MTNNELLALLRLQNIPNIGDITAKKLIRHCGSPSAIFSDKLQALLKIEGIGSYTLWGLHKAEYLRAAEKELHYILEHDIAYSCFMDAHYPEYLKHCVDSPIILFKRGKMALAGRRIISVVGTRNITRYGAAFCEQFVADIAAFNPIIVSGYAYGVDICVHKAALKHNLQTIACLAHGLNQIYPAKHKRYVPDVESNGGFITEFWSTSSPDRENFLKRNRIIAGISEATLVIESAEKGGSLVTADIAQSYNRDVFAVPGRVSDTYSSGCNNLIKQQKAHAITSAADLVYMLGWQISEIETPSIQKQLFVELDETEKNIYTYLHENGRQLLDRIALQCQIPVFRASSTLLTMEMKGMIRPLPGKLFEAI